MGKVTEREMAAILKVSYRTMANRRKAGTIKFFKVGGRYWYDPKDVGAFFQSTTNKEQAPPVVMETRQEQAIINRLLQRFELKNVKKVARVIGKASPDQKETYLDIFELLLGYGCGDQQIIKENLEKALRQKMAFR
jgi:hypothetical protein